MAQVLIDVNLPRKRNGKTRVASHALRRLFEETTALVRPTMRTAVRERSLPVSARAPWESALIKDMEYALDNKKYLERATYIRLAIESLGSDWRRYTDVLAGEEFLYVSQMLLDDIVDRQERRMGRPTINSLLGRDSATILAELFCHCGYRLILSGASELAVDRQQAILSSTFEMMRDIYYSQHIDVAMEKVDIAEVTVDDCLHFLRHTTPVDIANCFFVGTIIGGVSQNDTGAFRQFGHNVGMLMQIRDDFVDYLTEAEADKSTLVDLRGGKRRLPLVLAYQLDEDPSHRALLRRTLGRSHVEPDDSAMIRDIVLGPNVMRAARAVVSKFRVAALRAIHGMPISPSASGTLRQVVDGLVT